MITIEGKPVFTDYIKLEGREQWQTTVPLLHPESPQYAVFWSREMKKCIEGIWVKMFGKYRYMPGNLYYYGNYTLLQITTKNKVTKYEKPRLDDLEWEFALMSLEAKGFSGYELDDEFTSLELVRELEEEGVSVPTDYITENYPEAINQHGKLKKYRTPREAIRSLHNKPLGKCHLHNPTKNIMIMGSRGGGKAIPSYSTVYTPKGSTTIGEIAIGDKIIGKDGLPYNVIDIFPQGEKPIYEIELTDGRIIECDENHQWLLFYDKTHSKVLSTKELLEGKIKTKHKRSGFTYRWKLPIIAPVQHTKKKQPIDPYVFGALLGDGTMTTITPKIASSDIEIISRFRETLCDYDIVYDNTTVNNYTIVYRGEDKYTKGVQGGKNPLHRAIKKLGINKTCREKFIPDVYKYGSVEQRIELLRGLLDTDGSINKDGAIEFTTTGEQLASDVAELARSLGMRVEESYDKREGQSHEIKEWKGIRRKYYRLYIRSNNINPFYLPRKAERFKPARSVHVCISDVRKTTRSANQICIMVDAPDHLFLIKDYIPTHNSYYTGLGEIEYSWVFDGAKAYNKEFIDQLLTVELCVGASVKDKSAEMLAKVEASVDAKADVKLGRQFGVWEEEEADGTKHITPCPFYRSHKGNLNCPNKTNPFRYKYDVEQSGNWLEKGTGSKILHVNYSSNKGDGAQAAAGGRYAVSVVEEIGLVPNLKDIHISNASVVAREGVRFGVEWYIGTSGNIEYIQAAKEMFLNPQDYDIVAIDNKHSKEGKDGKIGFFLPFYLTLRQFKDKDGNTDFEAACKYINKLREEKKSSKNPKTIQGERMNRPVFINEMWVTGETNLLPYDEASIREQQLMEFEKYKYTGTAVKLVWDSQAANGVQYIVDHEAEPYFDYPINFEKRKDPKGCIMIYEFPQFINGVTPNDMYCFVGHDPYVEESYEGGGSVGSTYVMMNPKYIPLGFNGNTIVASYIDKPINGLREYYENQEKLMAFFGNPQQGLWFEKNRGQDCRGYYIGKNKVTLLAQTPQHAQGVNIFQQNIQSYGYTVGNRIVKTQLAIWMRDWLLEETELKDGVKKNIERIPDIYLIRQMMHYNLDDNFDAVDGFRGCIVGLRNNQVQVEAVANKKHDDKALRRLLNNPKIFRNVNRLSETTRAR